MENGNQLVSIDIDNHTFDQQIERLVFDFKIGICDEEMIVLDTTYTYTEWKKDNFDILYEREQITGLYEEILHSFENDDKWKETRKQLQQLIFDLSAEKPLPTITNIDCHNISLGTVIAKFNLGEKEESLYFIKDDSGEWNLGNLSFKRTNYNFPYLGAKSKITNHVKEHVKLFLLMHN